MHVPECSVKDVIDRVRLTIVQEDQGVEDVTELCTMSALLEVCLTEVMEGFHANSSPDLLFVFTLSNKILVTRNLSMRF